MAVVELIIEHLCEALALIGGGFVQGFVIGQHIGNVRRGVEERQRAVQGGFCREFGYFVESIPLFEVDVDKSNPKRGKLPIGGISWIKARGTVVLLCVEIDGGTEPFVTGMQLAVDSVAIHVERPNGELGNGIGIKR